MKVNKDTEFEQKYFTPQREMLTGPPWSQNEIYNFREYIKSI